MNISQKEVRGFKMHAKLLLDTIQRQSGGLPKAILEGVMNSVDAKATKVTVTVERNRVVLVDNGHGFPSKDSIDKFFETFGQPHSEEEKKVFGNFRIGRGQLYSWGYNTWRSGEFKMEVDIENRGLEYDLWTGQPHFDGCEISIALSRPQDEWSIGHLVREVSSWVRYVSIDVILNGEKVSESVSEVNWTAENELAYFKVVPGGSSGIEVYNRGVYVCTLPSMRYGASGIVVTKGQLKLNSARNDIMEICPLWRDVQRSLKKLCGAEPPPFKKLTDSQRGLIWRKILDKGGSIYGYKDHKIFVDATGASLSYNQLIDRAPLVNGKRAICFHEEGTHSADKIMQHRLAMVFSDSMLGYLNVISATAFLKKIHLDDGTSFDSAFALVDFDEVAKKVVGHDVELVLEKDLTLGEKMALSVAQHIERSLRFDERRRIGGGYGPLRRIYAGLSDRADGWTDGESYIAIHRRILKSCAARTDCAELVLLMIHEFCHRSSTTGEHIHDYDFYRNYHDLTVHQSRLIREANQILERNILVRSKRKKQSEDRAARRVQLKEAKAIIGVPDEEDQTPPHGIESESVAA